MRYLLMIYSEDSYYETLGEEGMAKLMEGYGKFTEELIAAGAMQDSARLQPVQTATTVRIRQGRVSNTDGPFAETKETIGGYYLIDVADLDAALSWAQKLPTASYGSIEVRPVWEMEEEGG